MQNFFIHRSNREEFSYILCHYLILAYFMYCHYLQTFFIKTKAINMQQIMKKIFNFQSQYNKLHW